MNDLWNAAYAASKAALADPTDADKAKTAADAWATLRDACLAKGDVLNMRESARTARRWAAKADMLAEA